MNIREIAQRTGISHTTVSRALNDSPLVAEKTKQRIKQVAKDLGYELDASAKSLATGIRMTIAVLYPYSTLRRIGSQYTSELIQSIRAALHEYRFDCIVNGYDTVGEDLSEMTRLIREKKVDGIIVLGYELNRDAVLALQQSTQNIVLINPNPTLNADGCARILIHNEYGGALAYEALRNAPKEQLFVLSHDRQQYAVRTEGFLKAMQSDNSHVWLAEDESFETAYRYIMEHKERLPHCKGLFVVTDIMAFGVCKALLELGYSIPDDIAVVGYDDIEWCAYCTPSLTTIHQPRSDVARQAASLIVQAVKEKASVSSTVVLTPNLVRRESTSS
ncbi:LacI family transcriptional regulator [Sphaerochaeta halotolerans]|uniref:LacI family transcriptional regulator n=1 Tax=Sphaerochaeta halotolerans TaxID=2293840 RepID=A0A372MJM0_9SPIR|nr:LacI family DNA-binding transcriptional regulator [Sphaerochaeta halotolerans]RFU95975.1 LacI family transcriptional regulator [Sphaerochaeta halotolerans]